MVVEIQLSMFNLSIGGSFFLLFFLPLSMCYCGLATVLHIGTKLLTDKQDSYFVLVSVFQNKEIA